MGYSELSEYPRGWVRQVGAGVTSIAGAGERVKVAGFLWEGAGTGRAELENHDGSVVYQELQGADSKLGLAFEASDGLRLQVTTGGNAVVTFWVDR